MVVARTVNALKREYLEAGNHEEALDGFTVDSPVPFVLSNLLDELNQLDSEMVKGSSGREKQGPFHGKLSRMIARLENRAKDRRLAFMFGAPSETMKYDWFEGLCQRLMRSTGDSTESTGGGVKIVDCSEVPSDIVPLVIGTICRLIFAIQQWTPKESRHPIALLCEEAHLYIPARPSEEDKSAAVASIFNRIAKEGRKYGVGLVVISQRPCEVSRTVLSQCNNFIAMRLTNAEDQGVVQRLLPDSLGGFADLLPILDTGEALVVGDACLLPSRVRVAEPTTKPASGTVDFWDEWSKEKVPDATKEAVNAMRCQQQNVS
jgi:hypothetical protein